MNFSHLARFYLQQKVNSLFSFQRQPPYALLLLNKFILTAEPLVDSLFHFVVNARSDAFLYFFIDLQHCSTLVKNTQNLEYGTRDETQGRDSVEDCGIDQEAVVSGSVRICHHIVKL